MEKITFRNVQIENRSPVIDFLLDMLLVKELTLIEKNRAYNVVAYLASIMGKSQVIANFQKLNSMLLISMEKIIDKKLSSIKSGSNAQRPEEQASCEYCGIVR